MIGLLALGGCTGAQMRPSVRVRMTGAQIPTELVESWLRDAHTGSFILTRPANPVWSQVGFDALARGDCDVACTDRRLTKRELEKFGQREVRGYRVGFYGYALYVNPENPLDSIFADHISQVFQKKIIDWSTLGGAQLPDLKGPIVLYGPRKATRGGMILMRQARIWFADATWNALDSDADVVAHVAADPAALGFASIGLDDQGVRYLGIRMNRTGQPAFPSLEEIETERYGLAKVIYVYCISPPNDAAQAVIDYLFSDDGRRAMAETEVWPIPWERAPVAPVP